MPFEQQQYKIHGMDCAEEVSVLKKELGPLVGGEEQLAFDLLNAKLTISVGSVAVAPETVLVAVARTGMKAELWQDGPRIIEEDSFIQRWGRTMLTAVSGLFTLVGFVTHATLTGSIEEAVGFEGTGLTHNIPLAITALYGLGILAGAWFVLPRAWLSFRRLRPDMNLLMAFAVSGAAGIGDWFEASTVAFLFSVSLLLEKWSVNHARHAVETLLDLTPPIARKLLPDGSQEEVSPDHVAVGSILLVKPGERFPLDGRVTHGNSHANQAPITGESLPVSKSAGEMIFAGTINGEGALEIEITKTSESTTLAHLIRMVSEAQSRRSHSEQWVSAVNLRRVEAAQWIRRFRLGPVSS